MAQTVKHVIIGTAGHVDHGKTELVRALTGRETDRLAEEKSRGISIVLGFAPIDLGPGVGAGVVDVPGHERFVKNMVSGAVGVDVALIAVAADEGVMPQTEEHFEVLRLLGVSSGVIAVTKADLVDEETAAIVESEVSDMLRGTPLEGAPFVRTSTVTGQGIERLREELAGTVRAAASRAPGQFFRMPVDRVFTRSGIGTIVTGTTWSGSVKAGDELVVEPAGARVRVREVQSFEHDVDAAAAGMRTAIALHGVKVEDVETGDQLVTPGILPRSSILDVRLEMSRLPGSRLRHRQRIRFHHAAAEILGRAHLRRIAELGPGDSGFVQLRLERPTVAMGSDHFVIRTYSPMRILAGGRILDPDAPRAKHADPGAPALLEALDSRDPRSAISGLALRAGPSGIGPAAMLRFGFDRGAAEEAAASLAGEGTLALDGGLCYHRSVVEEYHGRLMAVLERTAAENPLVWGIDREELRTKAGLSDMPLFEYLLTRGKTAGELFFKGGKVRAGSGELDLSDADRDLIERLRAEIEQAGWQYLSFEDLAARVGGDRRRLERCLHILQEDGAAAKIGRDGWIASPALERMIEGVGSIISGTGAMTVGDFKERFGVSRKFAVPLLEYLDARGYTRRDGDRRLAGPALGDR